MSYYACVGKTNYYPSKVDRGKFFDYFDYFQGLTKTPAELGVAYPFPESFTDANGRIWKLQNNQIKNANHQFFKLSNYNHEREDSYYKPHTREKSQPQNAPWGSCETRALWKNLKGNKLQ